jgi:4a-hydroxytetrahydrobiopterin dehydratase
MEWKETDNKLVREFEFKDFVEAFSFLTGVAILAEKANHHPTIENTYNKVKLVLTTHDAGNTITEKDHDLAKKINQLL